MIWNDRQFLANVARALRGVGWGAAVLLLLVGAFAAESGSGQSALLLRAAVAGVVLAVFYVAAWVTDRLADRAR